MAQMNKKALISDISLNGSVFFLNYKSINHQQIFYYEISTKILQIRNTNEMFFFFYDNNISRL